MTPNEALTHLQVTYGSANITLYLGAGVSVGNGLPTWEQLVTSMYFGALDQAAQDRPERPFPNYLFAIAEWHLKQHRADPEITARKVRQQYRDSDAFLESLKKTLWGGFVNQETLRIDTPPTSRILTANPTLAAVTRLCQADGTRRGVQAVITYNFDSLLEMALTQHHCEALWKAGMPIRDGKLPIYHVHGFVPIRSTGSSAAEIVFTEEQFHQAALDPLSWLNLVQIQALTSSTCVMVGMSLSDRNLRRLLEAIRKLPERRQHYAVLQRVPWPQPQPADLEQIHQNAMSYRARFENSGAKPRDSRASEIEQIIRKVHRQDWKQQTRVLRELGVEPIWYDEHSEVPGILDQILS